jgi:hypothetical protein
VAPGHRRDEARAQARQIDRLAAEVALEQGVVDLDARLEHLLMDRGHRAEVGLAGVVIEAVDHVGAALGRQVDAVEVGPEAGAQPLEHAGQRGRREVDLVDDDHAGQAELARGGVQAAGRQIDAGRGVDDEDRGLDRGQRGQGVADEVGVPRRVDHVDLAALMGREQHRRADRMVVGPGLRLVVAGRGGVLDRTHARDRAGAVEDGLGQGRLAGAGPPDERDVAQILGTEAGHLHVRAFVQGPRPVEGAAGPVQTRGVPGERAESAPVESAAASCAVPRRPGLFARAGPEVCGGGDGGGDGEAETEAETETEAEPRGRDRDRGRDRGRDRDPRPRPASSSTTTRR